MGYEVNILVGSIGHYSGYESARYFQLLATIDLHKPGYDSAIYRLATTINELDRQKVYVYLRDGNHPNTQDMYGADLKALTPGEVLDALESDSKNYPDYPPFAIAAYVVREVAKWRDDTRVILFGY